MPFGDYDSFDACVRDNSDKDDPEAYCAEIKRQVEGEDSLTDAESTALENGDCPEGQVSINGECVPIEETEIVPPLELSNGARFELSRLDTEPIEREELDGDKAAYRNLRLLDTGVWTDKKSQTPTFYGEEGMRNLEPAWDDNKHDGPPVNIMHDEDKTTGEPNETSVAGYIDPASLTVDDGAVYGDLIIETDTSAGAYADDNLQTTLESQGTAGFGGPSVELNIDPESDVQPSDHPRAKEELIGGRLVGAALVMDPASKSSSFARQTAERAVALSTGGGQTPMVYHLENDGMTDATVAADALLAQFDLDADDLDLADDRDLADVPVAELVSLIAEAYGADPAELMSALEPFLDEEEDVEAQEDEEDDDDDAEEGEMPDDEEEDDVDIDIDAEQVTALEERVTALEDMMDSMLASSDLEEELEDLADAESVGELESALADAEKRLASLEEEPKNAKTLADAGGDGEGEAVGPISPIEPSRSY